MASRLSSNKKKRWKKRTKPYNTPKPEDLEMLVGRWKLTSIHYEPYDTSECDELENLENGNKGFNLPECEGVEVTFDDQCDVTWHLPDKMDPIPLFLTTSFGIDKDTIDMIGGEDGRTFRFIVDAVNPYQDQLVLKTLVSNGLEDDDDDEGGEMVIVIDKACTTSEVQVDRFSLKEALDDGFFSDLTLHSSDGATFQAHRVVMSSTSCKMSYRDFEVLVSSMKAPLVKVILEFLYTDSLPTQLNLQVAKELSAAISSNPKLSHLAKLCQAFINSNNLKKRLIDLVDDLKALLEHAKHMIDNTEVSNPAKITYAIKQLAKEAVGGVAKLGMLCELYTRNKKDMTKDEKHEILEYVRGRVVVFIDLLSELIESAATKYNVLTESQKLETAIYIIPEVERIWDMVNATSKEAEEAMMAKVKSLNIRSVRQHIRRQDLKVAILLQFISKGRELKRLQKIGKEFQDFVLHSHRKREEFASWSEAEKAEKIMRVAEGLEGESANQIEQLSDLKKDILIDNALDWKKFKLLVAIICNYVSWGLRKVQGFKAPLRPAILRGCKFVQKPEVNDTLVYLDILDEADLAQLREDDQDDITANPTPSLPGLRSVLTSSESQLAQGCLKLLASQDYSDMKFVLMPHTPPTNSELPVTAMGRDGFSRYEEGEGVVITAHRVIVAARCEYFKRALQSGMKEAIDRCIVIHDCEEAVFRTFLNYLYGGTLDTSSMSVDDVIELLAVADRYETTSLRAMCESLLMDKVKDSSVFALLQVADHYSARRLREATLQHILTYPDLMMTEIDAFYGLPTELREEIRSITNSTNPQLAIRHTTTAPSLQKTPGETDLRHHSESTSSSSSSSASSNSFVANPHLADTFERNIEKSLDDFGANLSTEFGTPESVAFQQALKELKMVVGEEASDEALKEYLLAADMDINRALNFYFS